MRSAWLIGGLALIVAIVFIRGFVPRQATATESARNALPGLEFAYADFDDERSTPIARRPETTTTGTPAQDPAAAPRPDSAAPVVTDALESDAPGPIAEAGSARVAWIGDGSLVLDGSNSQGAIESYSWRQTAGEPELVIADPTAARTTAGGFPEEWTPLRDARYEFELTVTDGQGRPATDTVECTVKAAPSLTISPAPRTFVAERDGYALVHFEAWKTNRHDEQEVFIIRTPGELTFSPLVGDADYDVTVSPSAGGFRYEVVVYYEQDATSAWLEFFVTSTDQIPAILQLGVTWE